MSSPAATANNQFPNLDEPIQMGIDWIQKNLVTRPITITSNYLTLERTGVRLHYLRSGPSVTDSSCRGVLLFIHGWPDCSFGWRHQLAYFTQLGYICLVPDQRGFGASLLLDPAARTKPENYTWQLSCKDLELMCRHEHVRRCTVIGHDWGGAVCWAMARRCPQLCSSVIALCTPYRPAKSKFVSIEEIAQLRPLFYYQVYFSQKRRQAAAELEKDPQRVLTCMFRTSDKSDVIGRMMNSQSTSFLQHLPLQPKLSRLLTPEEMAVYVKIFKLIGFESSICWYGTSRLNWEQENWQWRDAVFDIRRADWARLNASLPPPAELVETLSPQIHQPALMVTAGADYVLKPSLSLGMEEWCPLLRRLHIEQASHWVQQEQHQQVNEGIKKFLEELPPWKNEPIDRSTTSSPSSSSSSSSAAVKSKL